MIEGPPFTSDRHIALWDLITHELADCQEQEDSAKRFEAVNLGDELYDIFWRGTEPDSPQEREQEQMRLNARAWAFQELERLAPNFPHGFRALRLALTVIQMSFRAGHENLEAELQRLTNPALPNALVQFLASFQIQANPSRYRGNSEQWREELGDVGGDHYYRTLGDLIRYQFVELPADAHLAVILLKRLAPLDLARCVDEKQDVFFSIAVREILGDEAIHFALHVEDVPYKFVCASPLANVVNSSETRLETLMCELLLQVAQTPHWRAWLFDFAQYPQSGSVAEAALGRALAQLTPLHWADFVDAAELWTLASSPRAVGGILIHFYRELGDEKSRDMWNLAFTRWNAWDYGGDGSKEHLLSPSTCSFDFPVAMHYSQMPAIEAQAEEARLLAQIGSVEQKWFADVTELSTYRNRLSSRLRLVQHGIAIRSATGKMDALPPPIKPDSEFARVRYRFHDVNARYEQ
jgi:hypothetical protein